MNGILFPLRRVIPLLLATCVAIALMGAGASLTELGPWYRSLRMPPWKPADWMFPVMWTIVFGLWIFAVDIAWRRSSSGIDRVWLVGCLALNGALNVLWSGLFFRMHRPDLALVEVGFLWFSIPLAMYAIWRARRWAAWLLVPYLGWVSVAALLNMAVVRMNYDMLPSSVYGAGVIARLTFGG